MAYAPITPDQPAQRASLLRHPALRAWVHGATVRAGFTPAFFILSQSRKGRKENMFFTPHPGPTCAARIIAAPPCASRAGAVRAGFTPAFFSVAKSLRSQRKPGFHSPRTNRRGTHQCCTTLCFARGCHPSPTDTHFARKPISPVGEGALLINQYVMLLRGEGLLPNDRKKTTVEDVFVEGKT